MIRLSVYSIPYTYESANWLSVIRHGKAYILQPAPVYMSGSLPLFPYYQITNTLYANVSIPSESESIQWTARRTCIFEPHGLMTRRPADY
jgi:hypothetical protein